MGLSGISPLSLLLILFIVIALFGTNKVKALGTDLGEAIKNFRRSLDDKDGQQDKQDRQDKDGSHGQ